MMESMKAVAGIVLVLDKDEGTQQMILTFEKSELHRSAWSSPPLGDLPGSVRSPSKPITPGHWLAGSPASMTKPASAWRRLLDTAEGKGATVEA